MNELKVLSKEDYDKLTAFEQGYATYMQGEWNNAIPNDNPHNEGGKAWTEWNRGNLRAMQNTQDMEE